MARRVNNKLNKFFKGLGIFGAVLTLLTSVALVGFLVLDVMQLNALVSDGPRSYIIQFTNENVTVSIENYRRGATIVVPGEQYKAPDEDDNYNYTYTFKGWDMTGDGVADLIPHLAYYSFQAKAVYNRKGVAKPKPPKSSSEENPSSSSRRPWFF